MRLARTPLLIALLAAAAGSQARAANAPVYTGGWGDAWAEDERAAAAPAPAPARSPQASTLPLPSPLPQASPQPAAAPHAQAWPQAGGWGQAWDDGDRTAPAAPSRAATAPVPPPTTVQAAVPAPTVVTAQVQPSLEQPAQPSQPRAAPAPAAPAAPASAPAEEDEPVNLTADQIIHDRELGIVTAVGRVEIVQQHRTLVANTVSYNLKEDVVSASGNVTLLEPSGEVIFADYVELTGDLKTGVAEEIRVLLADKSRMAAATARRVGGMRTDFDKAVYTACEPCKDNPSKAPIWQTKAELVTQNKAEEIIEYRDAWLEMWGVPVAYTPYMSHPDPSVKRKSGFLVPSAGVNSTLGTNATVPYFWAIAPNQDITFSPRFLAPKSSKRTADSLDDASDTVLKHVVLAGEHRWIGRDGETKSMASLTADKYDGDLRGHIDAKGRFDLNNRWRTGYQIQRASDDTYTSLYGYRINTDRPWLTTRPYLEGFGTRNFAMAEAFAFQGIRSDDDDKAVPLVLPHMAYSYVGDPSPRGGFWKVDTDLLAYARDEGTDAGRLSTQVAWQRPFRSRLGELYTFTASLRGDGYHSVSDQASQEDGTAGRVIPQMALNWRLPFTRQGRHLSQIIEPLAMVAVSPNGGNPANIPNEDAIDVELDEMNVLRPNRMPGLDRVEGGPRGAYGLRWTGYPSTGGLVIGQIAQGWRAHADTTYGDGTGFKEELSDYMGRVQVSPGGHFTFMDRVRLDKDSLEIRRHEAAVSLGPRALRANASYVFFDRTDGAEGSNYGNRQYVAYGLSSELTRYWSWRGVASHDLTDAGGPLGWTSSLLYNDECFAFRSDIQRTYTYDRDIESGYTITFHVIFKTLGDVPFNAF